MVAQDIPAVLQQHAKKIRQSAVLVETHADLPTRALIEAMDMIHECGIQRVAVLPFSD